MDIREKRPALILAICVRRLIEGGKKAPALFTSASFRSEKRRDLCAWRNRSCAGSSVRSADTDLADALKGQREDRKVEDILRTTGPSNPNLKKPGVCYSE